MTGDDILDHVGKKGKSFTYALYEKIVNDNYFNILEQEMGQVKTFSYNRFDHQAYSQLSSYHHYFDILKSCVVETVDKCSVKKSTE